MGRARLVAFARCRLCAFPLDRGTARAAATGACRCACEPSVGARPCVPRPAGDARRSHLRAFIAARWTAGVSDGGTAAVARRGADRRQSRALAGGARSACAGGYADGQHAACASRHAAVFASLLAIRAGRACRHRAAACCVRADGSLAAGRFRAHRTRRFVSSARCECDWCRLAKARLCARRAQCVQHHYGRSGHRQDDDGRQAAGFATDVGTRWHGSESAAARTALADPSRGADRQGRRAPERVDRWGGGATADRCSAERRCGARGDSNRRGHTASGVGHASGQPTIPSRCGQSVAGRRTGDR